MKAEGKRTDYISWEEYFMSIALLAAQRSKDPNTQVGAVIVNKDRKIIATGYNGMPNGCSDDIMPWNKTDVDPLNTKYLYVCHAEMNAVLNRNCESTKGATLYTSLFPCAECAKIIIQSGISEVVFLRIKQKKVETIAAKRMFDNVGIQYRKFESSRKIVLDFSEIGNESFTDQNTAATFANNPTTPNYNKDKSGSASC